MTYTLKIKKLEIENIMDTLLKNSYYTTKDNVLVRKIGINLKQLRTDKLLVIANDKRTGESVLILKKLPSFNPDSVTKIKGRRTTYNIDDLVF